MTLTPSQVLLDWLNKLLAIHISSDLVVSIDIKHSIVIIQNNADKNHKIEMPYLSRLWSLETCDPTTRSIEGLPALGLTLAPNELITKIQQTYYFHYDVLGLAFWMLNRIEELSYYEADEHGRFAAKNSHAYKHDYLTKPIVDLWFIKLKKLCHEIWPDISYAESTYSIDLSHDVDMPSRYGFRSFRSFLGLIIKDSLYARPCELWRAIRLFMSKNQIHPDDPDNRFDWLMDISDQQNTKSTFYFLAGRTNIAKDARYTIDDPEILELLQNINRREHKFGLHPSYNCYLDESAIASEYKALKSGLEIALETPAENISLGGRMHYLRWKTHTTLNALNNIGLQYDATLGYADHIGFRCGTCKPYPAYDPIKNAILDISIVPLIVMDSTLLDDIYMGLSIDDAYAEACSVINACKEVSGKFTLLWHNSYLQTQDKKDLYKKIVSHAAN